MAVGSMTINNIECELFEAIESSVDEVIDTISAIITGNAGGISAEHLSKQGSRAYIVCHISA